MSESATEPTPRATKMNEKHLAVRNIQRFQHYKDRGPLWVKFYAQTLRDEEFNGLPAATRLLAIYLIVVASQRDNRIPNDPAWIATECSLSLRETRAGIDRLLAVHYLIPASELASNNASNNASETASNGSSKIASRTASAVPARSRVGAERREREKDSPSISPSHSRRVTICPHCKAQLDYDPPTGDVIPDDRIERTAYRHLVDVHGWEEDRAADVAAKTVKEALR